MADLSKKSRKQLEQLIKDAQKALKSLEAKEKRVARAAAEAAAAKFGFKLSELTGPAKKEPSKSKATKSGQAKYANPQDPSQTWSGKGRQPGWFKDAIASGADPASLKV
jgi:DNA-binding protein H-NS